MDNTDKLLWRLAGWVGTLSAPPVIYAALHRGRGSNTPAPIMGFSMPVAQPIEYTFAGTRRVVVRPGEIAVTSCHHGASTQEEMEGKPFWAIAFSLEGSDAFDDLWRDPVFVPVPVADPARVEEACRRVALLYPPHGDTEELRLKSAVLDLIAVVLEEKSALARPGMRGAPAFRNALGFLRAHYHDAGVRVADIAAAAHLSERHLARLFRQETGRTPMRYLRDLRMARARYLLHAGEVRVDEVARAVGFQDPLHFSRVFRSDVGLAPRDYRLSADNGAARVDVDE